MQFQKEEEEEKTDIIGKIISSINQFKLILENCLFLSLVAIFIVSNFQENLFIQQFSLIKSIQSNFAIQENYKSPEQEIIQFLNNTIPPDDLQGRIFPTVPLKKAVIIQKLAEAREYSQCLVFNPEQDKELKRRNETCLNYD